MHNTVGLDCLATHTEFRLTSRGPRIIELNARLGGDLIPYAGRLALGVDLAGAAAEVALGRQPTVQPRVNEVAAVQIFYPPFDMRFESLELTPDFPGLDRLDVLVRPGDTLRLRPRGFMSRIAIVIVRTADHEECAVLLRKLQNDLVVHGTPE